jgi:hypothetical protein
VVRRRASGSRSLTRACTPQGLASAVRDGVLRGRKPVGGSERGKETGKRIPVPDARLCAPGLASAVRDGVSRGEEFGSDGGLVAGTAGKVLPAYAMYSGRIR